MFEPGQLVLCVDDKPLSVNAYPGWVLVPDMDGLRSGAVYRIRAVGPSHLNGTVLDVWLEEIVRPVQYDEPVEPGFSARRFRPLRDTAIDIFREALAPAPKQTEPA